MSEDPLDEGQDSREELQKLNQGAFLNSFRGQPPEDRADRGAETRVKKDDLEYWADHDADKHKTLSRWFVEKQLIKFKWYYPNKDISDRPNLKEGWAFYEHITLPRHEEEKVGDVMKLSPPGEKEGTKLYGFWETPDRSLKSWGVGIGLYFDTLKIFALILFIAGIFNARNIAYFRSNDYDDQKNRTLGLWISGSAVCNAKEWVTCETGFCVEQMMDEYGVTYATDNNGTFYLQRTNCPFQDSNDNDLYKAGIVNFFTFVLLVILTVSFSYYQRLRETIMNEDQITASDYSIRVTNPPENALDPDEWRDFFETFSGDKGVTMVTINLNNAPLLRALKNRRLFCSKLKQWLPDLKLVDLDLDDIQNAVNTKMLELENKPTSCGENLFNVTLGPILRIFGMNLAPDVLLEKIKQATEEVKELQKQKYDVANVLITFECEAGKRNALKDLTVSSYDIMRQDTDDKDHLFKGRLLHLIEPSEPSALIYLNLDVSTWRRISEFTVTLLITIGLVALSAFLVTLTRKSLGPSLAGYLTATLNTIIPIIVRLLLLIENHPREDDLQRSLYIKITLFRWVNTAITAKFAIPATSTLGNESTDLLVAISGIMFYEIWLTPLLSLLDIMGNLRKHYWASRAINDEQMKLCFKGTIYDLADKYTDITKIIFVCYFYCSLDPTLLFMGALALFIRYSSDKYCLLRIWGRVPEVGTQIAEFSRKYFLSAAIVVGTIVSAYNWAQFGFDRVCFGTDSDETNTETFNKMVTVGSEGVYSTIEVRKTVFGRACNDDKCCQEVGLEFPPVPSRFEDENFEWMSDGQKTLTSFFGWLSVAVLAIFLLGAFGDILWTRLISLCKGKVDESKLGMDQNIDFSNLEDVAAYIPQIRGPSFPYPLIACDIDEVPLHYLGFQIPDESIDDYNVLFDVPYDGMKRREKIHECTDGFDMLTEHPSYKIENESQEEHSPIFDIVKCWPYGGKY